MSTNLTKKNGTALSSSMADALVSGIAESRSSTPIAGGVPLLRLLKSGSWVFGQSDEVVQEGSSWAVNPLSILHGWSCWTNRPGTKEKNELMGERMVSITERKPLRPEPVDGWDWNEQRQFGLKCLDGDDEGTEVLYKTSSVGGMRAVDGLLAALVAQLKVDAANPVAILQLEVDSYQHAKYGQTFVPILEVVGWMDMAGNAPETAQDDPDQQPDDYGGDDEDEVDTTPQPEPKAAKANGKTVKTPLAKEPVAKPETVAARRPGSVPTRQRPVERA